jgi:hypothetical protein
MPANPQIGDIFNNEFALGVAEDQEEVIDINDPISVPAGDFVETVTKEKCNPLVGAEKDIKVYAKGIGIVIDGNLELLEVRVVP